MFLARSIDCCRSMVPAPAAKSAIVRRAPCAWRTLQSGRHDPDPDSACDRSGQPAPDPRQRGELLRNHPRRPAAELPDAGHGPLELAPARLSAGRGERPVQVSVLRRGVSPGRLTALGVQPTEHAMGAPPLTALQLAPALNAGGAGPSTLEIGAALVAPGHRSLAGSAAGGLVA